MDKWQDGVRVQVNLPSYYVNAEEANRKYGTIKHVVRCGELRISAIAYVHVDGDEDLTKFALNEIRVCEVEVRTWSAT
jgi:hypothetical protein